MRSRCSQRWTGRWLRRAGAARLPITYHIGPGPAKVHLKVEFQLGHQADLRRDRAHSGIDLSRRVGDPRQSSRRVGERRGRSDLRACRRCWKKRARWASCCKQGWKPKRTIIYCAWDGEEPGLLGSTEWVETHADELRQHAVAYINSDSNSRGFLCAGGSHTLEKLRERCRARCAGSREDRCPCGSGGARAISRKPVGRRERTKVARPESCRHRRAGLRLRLHACSSTTWASRR